MLSPYICLMSLPFFICMHEDNDAPMSVLIHIRIKGDVIKHCLFFKLCNIPFEGGGSFVDPFCYLCFMSIMLSCPLLTALCLSGKGLASLLSCMAFCHFPLMF